MSSGPDQILPSESFTSTLPDGSVKLRIGKTLPDNYEPVSIPTLVKKTVENGADLNAMAVKRNGSWIKWTFKEYLEDIKNAAKAFIALGLKPRQSVGIIGFNAPEWSITELAAIFANAMTAGLYLTNNAETCKYILQHSQANILVVEDESQLEKILPFKDELAELRAIIQYTGEPTVEGVISWKELLDMGKRESCVELNKRLKNIAINQCCHLVYTSGTTGQPKGVMLSHDNIIFASRRLSDFLKIQDGVERVVSYLPLSHIAANIFDIFTMAFVGGTVYFADKNALKGSLVTTLQEVKPTIFFGVPRVWEKIMEKMLEVGRQNKGLKRQIGNWAKKTGFSHNYNLLSGSSRAGGFKYKIANSIVFQKVKSALGLDKCLRFHSVGAPLSKDVWDYFLSLDLKVFDIYGMSECTGPQLGNYTVQDHKPNTLGKEFPGLHVKIQPMNDGPSKEITDEIIGEVRIRGRNVMMGYLFEDDKTNEAFDDQGWLKSGDIGMRDYEGYYSITGRIKELLVTAGGENVAPIPIEAAIKVELPCISNAMVIGDRRKFLSCLLTLQVELETENAQSKPGLLAPNALSWCEAIGSKASTVEEALNDFTVASAIQDGITRANEKATSNAQKIQKWAILSEDFSVASGDLGPTLKMKRHFILQKNQKIVDTFYA